MCDGARKLAVPTGLDDPAGLLDSHDRTIEYFPIGLALVILLLAERPFEGPASEGISWTGSVAGPIAAIAGVEVGRTGRHELSLDEDSSKTDTRSKLRRDHKVVFADHPQAGQMGGVLEESPPKLDLVRQRKGLDSEFFTQPDTQLFGLPPHHSIAGGKARAPSYSTNRVRVRMLDEPKPTPVPICALRAI